MTQFDNHVAVEGLKTDRANDQPLVIAVTRSSGVSTGGGQGATAHSEIFFALCLPPPPSCFKSFLLNFQCFLRKLFNRFITF